MPKSPAAAICMGFLLCSAVTGVLSAHMGDFGLEDGLYDIPKFKRIDGFGGSRKMLQSEYNQLVLITAVSEGDIDVVKRSLDAGVNPEFITTDGKYSPLIVAAGLNHVDILRLLLNAGATTDLRTGHDTTALDYAAVRNALESVQILLDAGADPNSEDKKGLSALHYASIKGHVEVVRVLIDAGGDFELRTGPGTAGETPLHFAAAFGQVPIIKFLVERGVNVDVGNTGHDNAPLQRAAAHNEGEAILALIEAGADINRRNLAGQTALYSASLLGNQDTIEILLQTGADKSIRDNAEVSVRDVLCQCIFFENVPKSCNGENCSAPEEMIGLLDP